MTIFRQKPWVNPFTKMPIFRFFWTSCFYSLEWCFFFLEYRKTHFVGLNCLKRKGWKKVEKMAIFRPKPWVNPFGKMPIFRFFWTSCFYSLEWCFFFLEYRKTHFVGLNCLKRKGWKKVEKMAIFRPKPWVNPFGKMPIFRLFELIVFIA